MVTKEQVTEQYNHWWNAETEEELINNPFQKLEREFFKRHVSAEQSRARTYAEEHIRKKDRKTYNAFYVHLLNKWLGIPIKTLCKEVKLNRSYYYDIKEKISSDKRTCYNYIDFEYEFTHEEESGDYIEARYKELLESAD